MKISDAIILGSTTCKMLSGDWNSCALGAAANAVGIPASETENAWSELTPDGLIMHSAFEMGDGRTRQQHIEDIWPWLNENAYGIPTPLSVVSMKRGFVDFEVELHYSPATYATTIFSRFDSLVAYNRGYSHPNPDCQPMTLEQLVEFVRSIEPDCGGCNRFECTCTKDTQDTHTLEHQEV